MADKKYKLSEDYWETSGIYDNGLGKTQRDINNNVIGTTAMGTTATTLTGAIAEHEGDIGDLNDIIAKIDFTNVQTIETSGEDLDTYTDGGIWYFSSSYVPLNKPSGTGNFGFLVVVKGGNNARLMQFWLYQATNDALTSVYYRGNSYNTLTWSSWHKIATDVTAISTSGDLNDYKTSGFYYFPSTQTNIPAGSNGWLLVIGAGADERIKQIWFRYGTNNSNDYQTYVRTYSNGSNDWSDWRKFIVSDDLEARNILGTTETIDFDTDKSPLVYFDYANSTGTKPSFTTNGYLLNIYRSTSYQVQVAFQRDLSDGVYMRAKSGGTWGSWELAQGYDGRFYKFTANADTAYNTVADLVTLATSHATNDIFIHRLGADLLSSMTGSTTTLGGSCLLMKASSSNAYYLAWNRNVIGIGNLNLGGSGLNYVKKILVEEYVYTNLTLSSVATNLTAYAKAYGKTVNVVGNYSADVSRTADWTPMCTLPSGYRPSTTIYFVGVNNITGDMPYMYRINTSGIVAVYSASTVTKLRPRFCFTFIV